MKLGEIIDALKDCDPTSTIRYDFSYDGPDYIESYRGFYNELALTGLRYGVTVAEVLKMCEKAVGATFTGYKGGDEGYCVIIHTEFAP